MLKLRDTIHHVKRKLPYGIMFFGQPIIRRRHYIVIVFGL